MDITFTIPDDKLAEFRIGFLKSNPIPLGDDGNPEMSELEWFRFWVRCKVLLEYRKGKIKLAKEAVIIDEGVII